MRHVILNYHGIGTPARPLETGEDAYWITRDFFVETLDIADRLRDRVTVSVTFDDGNASDAEIGAVELARRDRRGAFFVLADRIDMPGSLSSGDIARLVAEGHEIGSHGAAHVDWRGLDDAGRAREYDAARARIAAAAGRPVDTAAIPFGSYRRRVIADLSRRGYRRIHTSDGGSAGRGLVRARTSLRADMTPADVERAILGGQPAMVRLRRFATKTAKRVI